MKILIYGHKGWIGSQFCKILEEQNIGYSPGYSRVNNEKSLQQEIIKMAPYSLGPRSLGAHVDATLVGNT